MNTKWDGGKTESFVPLDLAPPLLVFREISPVPWEHEKNGLAWHCAILHRSHSSQLISMALANQQSVDGWAGVMPSRRGSHSLTQVSKYTHTHRFPRYTIPSDHCGGDPSIMSNKCDTLGRATWYLLINWVINWQHTDTNWLLTWRRGLMRQVGNRPMRPRSIGMEAKSLGEIDLWEGDSSHHMRPHEPMERVQLGHHQHHHHHCPRQHGTRLNFLYRQYLHSYQLNNIIRWWWIVGFETPFISMKMIFLNTLY